VFYYEGALMLLLIAMLQTLATSTVRTVSGTTAAATTVD